MASGMQDGKFDIHHSSRKLNNAVRYLNECRDICLENKRKILEFQAWLDANGFSPLRQVFYIQHLTWIARMLRRPFGECTKQHLIELMRAINGKDWSEWTKRGYSIVVKKFWRWLRNCSDDEGPLETKWVKIKNIKESSLLPDDLLTREDVRIFRMEAGQQDAPHIRTSFWERCGRRLLRSNGV